MTPTMKTSVSERWTAAARRPPKAAPTTMPGWPPLCCAARRSTAAAWTPGWLVLAASRSGTRSAEAAARGHAHAEVAQQQGDDGEADADADGDPPRDDALGDRLADHRRSGRERWRSRRPSSARPRRRAPLHDLSTGASPRSLSSERAATICSFLSLPGVRTAPALAIASQVGAVSGQGTAKSTASRHGARPWRASATAARRATPARRPALSPSAGAYRARGRSASSSCSAP